MSCDEIDTAAMQATAKFCAYSHARPDGSVFYIGKGLRRRAHDFAPSRRSRWHRNIVAKHGRDNIIVRVIPCAHESEAFALECALIAAHKNAGVELTNLTDGGEGAAGRVANEAQLAALAKGRQKGKPGHKGPRPYLTAWVMSPEGREHTLRVGHGNKGRVHAERQMQCANCGIVCLTRSPKATACGKRCSQILYRAKVG